MYGRWYCTAILVFWLASMSWLVTRKLLPPLVVGDPPDAQAVLAARQRDPLVGWELQLNRKPLGWATSRSVHNSDGSSVLWGWVHIEGLPLRDAAPAWLQEYLKGNAMPSVGLTLDAYNSINASPRGKITGFRSTLWIRPLEHAIELAGTFQGNRLALEATCGQLKYATEAVVPTDSLLADSLSPQTVLPGLHVGQSWRLPCYSPLRPPNAPLEIIEATVEGEDTIAWGEGSQRVLVVTYRTESGFSALESQPQARAWVRHDGTVLQQEALFFDRLLRFVRMPPEKAAQLVPPDANRTPLPEKEP